ncbi:pimeloyl-[acyl-carrier protein] methyl ester esterase [Paraperlucidibaca baekdonensis]|uniref:Pimeloyl-[acyl-carrier protein] methyl ester esterase n=1 Tax=Paraperlucidibaca baekdonensis TaxID=748120 RepID=A0A3E0H9X4_9GAMM|nr:pimeloyl-ACP methyl ester esterase BioH [Paraperlucidibaca baekdonensis]REH40499.1 pimeloyl-[acyl-carrier protein] methyl ester esterase [Paraperlucidibaca baekdonensis]
MPALMLYHDTYHSTGPLGSAAPDLVLLHGWGLHSIVFDPIVPFLLERYCVTVIDLPGMGRSPLPNAPLSVESVVAQLAEVAPERALWLGWSLGGELALAYAQAHPARVSALMLIASNPCFVQRPDWSHAMPEATFTGFSEFFDEDPEATLIRFLSLQCMGSARAKADIRFLQEIMYFHGLPAPRALRESLQLLQDMDQREAFAQLPIPIAMILGRHDQLVPALLAEDLLALRSTLAIRLIDGAGHAPFLAQPEAFQQALAELLGEMNR